MSELVAKPNSTGAGPDGVQLLQTWNYWISEWSLNTPMSVGAEIQRSIIVPTVSFRNARRHGTLNQESTINYAVVESWRHLNPIRACPGGNGFDN